MATNLAKIHFLATKGEPPSAEKPYPGSNAIIIQDYDQKNDKYVYGMIDMAYGHSKAITESDKNNPDTFDTRLLLNYLKAHKITTLEFVIITHYHIDHYGNLEYLLNNYATEKIKIKNLILPMDTPKIEKLKNKLFPDEYERIKGTAQRLKDAFNKKYIKSYPSAKLYFFGKNSDAEIEKVCKMGTGSFKFYNTNGEVSDYPVIDAGETINNRLSDKFSIVTVYTVQGRKVLFTGDIYKFSELVLKDTLADDYDLIEMSHHGSSSANCQEFLDMIVPIDKEFAAIQLRSSTYNSLRALTRYLNYENARVYGVYQDFEGEWGNADEENRGSIVAEFKDGVVKYYSRRVYGSSSYAQKLIKFGPENNVQLPPSAASIMEEEE